VEFAAIVGLEVFEAELDAVVVKPVPTMVAALTVPVEEEREEDEVETWVKERYPNNPLPPHVSVASPGHGSSHSLGRTTSVGASFEHQQSSPCTIANAYSNGKQKPLQKPLDWYGLDSNAFEAVTRVNQCEFLN
jgi:hypothetical protein